MNFNNTEERCADLAARYEPRAPFTDILIGPRAVILSGTHVIMVVVVSHYLRFELNSQFEILYNLQLHRRSKVRTFGIALATFFAVV